MDAKGADWGKEWDSSQTASAKELEKAEFLRHMMGEGDRATYARSRMTAVGAPLEEAYRSVKGELSLKGPDFHEWRSSCSGAKF